jgi:hypothetical protein
LRDGRGRLAWGTMSAAEIIAMIERLPAAEQQQVRDYLENKIAAAEPEAVRRMTLAKAKAVGEGVFERHDDLFRRLAE